MKKYEKVKLLEKVKDFAQNAWIKIATDTLKM